MRRAVEHGRTLQAVAAVVMLNQLLAFMLELVALTRPGPFFARTHELGAYLGYRDDGITHVTARFGFQDDLDVPRSLRRAATRLERDADFEHVSYFLSRISIIPGKTPGMALWRKKLFIAIARNAASPVPYFHLPDDRTIVMASHIEL